MTKMGVWREEMRHSMIGVLWRYFWSFSMEKNRIFVELFGEQNLVVYEEVYSKHEDYREALHESFRRQVEIIEATWIYPLPDVMPGMIAYGVVNCHDHNRESGSCSTCGWGLELEAKASEPPECFKPMR